MATYNYGQLEQLWQQAGGSSKLAPIMAAIALAESGGHTGATHHDSNGSTDYGLWQINSIHGYNTGQLLSNPLYNAKAAVAIERSSGLHAWSTYNNGSYKKYLTANTSSPNVNVGGVGVDLALPYNPNTSSIGRIDQGVDITSSSPFMAISSGRIVHIDPNFYNGTPAVYERLDHPITVNGRTYKAVYYSETKSLVHVGQHVAAGQQVIGPGTAEIGFASQFGSSSSSWLPAGHNQFSGNNRTQAGSDFSAAINKIKAVDKIQGILNQVTKTGSSPSAAASQTASNVLNATGLGGLSHFLSEIGSASFWLRTAEMIGGGILVLLGLYLLAKQVGLGGFDVPLPSAATSAADTAAAQAETAQMTQQFREREANERRSEAKERRAEEAHMAQLEERSARADLARARAETARTNRQPRVIHQHYTDTPTSTRRQQFAARASDPATNEISF